jgi:hypothetical protein
VNRVGLQEYFEKILEFRFTAFDKIIDSRFTSMEKATQLQAKIDGELHRERSSELARRLDHLNNEAGRLAADKVTTADLKEIHARLEAVLQRLASLEKDRAIAVFLAVAIPIAIQIAINYFRK